MSKLALVKEPQALNWKASDVAKYYGVTPQAVYRWAAQGKIPVHRTPGGSPRFVEAEVKAAQVKRGGQHD